MNTVYIRSLFTQPIDSTVPTPIILEVFLPSREVQPPDNQQLDPISSSLLQAISGELLPFLTSLINSSLAASPQASKWSSCSTQETNTRLL